MSILTFLKLLLINSLKIPINNRLSESRINTTWTTRSLGGTTWYLPPQHQIYHPNIILPMRISQGIHWGTFISSLWYLPFLTSKQQNQPKIHDIFSLQFLSPLSVHASSLLENILYPIKYILGLLCCRNRFTYVKFSAAHPISKPKSTFHRNIPGRSQGEYYWPPRSAYSPPAPYRPQGSTT